MYKISDESDLTKVVEPIHDWQKLPVPSGNACNRRASNTIPFQSSSTPRQRLRPHEFGARSVLHFYLTRSAQAFVVNTGGRSLFTVQSSRPVRADSVVNAQQVLLQRRC
jgi:hypothetical protein